ncbi:MAG: NYN domain-containing protein [Actinomycetota bacterium]|nr:NYN domain-containing protein [Actinomycetota bacterium]
MAEPTLYLFDGHNLLHAGTFDDQRELTDALASFVAVRGARGILVWDGGGTDAEVGPLSVRYAPHADTLLERLSANHRDTEEVVLVSSDFAVRGTSGRRVQKRSSRSFLDDLQQPRHEERQGSRLGDSLDAETKARLERLRRGEDG